MPPLLSPLLSVVGLQTPVVSATDLRLDAGECLAVEGASGSGKSRLLRAIADLDPNRGEVRLDGRLRSAMPAPRWRRLVTYVWPDAGWWTDRVGDHFSDERAAAEWLPRLGLPDGALDWPVARASTGERQRLALVRALVQHPRVLLLDEPTGALDPDATARVEAVLRDLLAAGTGIILVTHDAGQARRLAHRRMRVEGGMVREVGETQQCP